MTDQEYTIRAVNKFLEGHTIGDPDCAECSSDMGFMEEVCSDCGDGLLHYTFEDEFSDGSYLFWWCCEKCGYNNIADNRYALALGKFDEVIRAKPRASKPPD